MKRLGIYVPKEGTSLASSHPRGTGFVGEKQGKNFLLHYEEPGNYSNVITLEDRLSHAAGRMTEKYPTSKMCAAKPNDIILVGTVTYCEKIGWYISDVMNSKELEQWASGPHSIGGSLEFRQRVIMRNINGKQQ